MHEFTSLRRWGINPSVPKDSDGKSRSGLTPTNTGEVTIPPRTIGPGTTEQWTEEFQSFWFEG